jgi:hypothetical protein
MEWLADTTNSACFSGHCHHRAREHCTRCANSVFQEKSRTADGKGLKEEFYLTSDFLRDLLFNFVFGPLSFFQMDR